jgi:hypothetical protein
MNYPVVRFMTKGREYPPLKREWPHRTEYRNYGKAETNLQRKYQESPVVKITIL